MRAKTHTAYMIESVTNQTNAKESAASTILRLRCDLMTVAHIATIKTANKFARMIYACAFE